MAWSKEEVESLIGGNRNTDEQLDQCKESATQSSFIIPSNNIPVDDPNRYIIEGQSFKDLYVVEILKGYNRKYLRSAYLAIACGLSGFICLAIGGFSSTKKLMIFGACLIGLCFIIIICKTIRIPGKAKIFYRQSLVRQELGHYIAIEAYNEMETELNKWYQPDINIPDLLDYQSDEELINRLVIGGPNRSFGEIRNAFRGKYNDTYFRFIDFSLTHRFWCPSDREYWEFGLYNGHCIVFQTSVSIPFPVQYDYIPNALNSKTNDFYQMFHCYRYQYDNDIYAGSLIDEYVELCEHRKLYKDFRVGMSLVTNNVTSNGITDCTQYLLDYYKKLDDFPQEYKEYLCEEDQEIMNTIESEEFQKTLLGIAQTLKDKRWSIRLVENNLILFRPYCNIFEFNINLKNVDEQLYTLEHEISNLVGILDLLSKLSIVRGGSE